MKERPGFSPSERFRLDGAMATALVGRVAELQELEEALRRVRSQGTCVAVTLLGAAGIGKSRLVRDFLLRTRSADDVAPPRVYRGNARAGGPAHEVFARALRARFGIVEGMDAEAAKAQVRAAVSQVLEDRKVGDVVYFLGQLIELDFADSPLIKAVQDDALQLCMLRRAVLKRFLEADAQHVSQQWSAKGASPIVLVFDDLHYAHDESLDLVAYLIELLKAPVLILCLARPEMSARRDDWLRQGAIRHALLEVAPLSHAHAATVMNDLLAPCGNAEGTEDLVEVACNLAGGNPALLEQMVRIYLDSGVLEVHHRSEADIAGEEVWSIHVDRLATVRLPLTVEDAIAARIAGLATAEREVLERAAAMGGVFWLGALASLGRLDAPPPAVWEVGSEPDVERIRGVLADLVERDYILRLPDSTFPGDEEYVFKHNLEREALVKLTPAGVARRYHQTIADWIAFKDSAKTNEEYLAMLARHRERAGARMQAAAAYILAADVARSRYANTTAAEYYAKGLALSAENSEADPDARLRALHHYGDVLQLLGRNDEAQTMFRGMLALSFRLGLRAKGGAAHSRLGRLHRETGELDEAARHLDAAHALFEAAQDPRGIASTLDDTGKLHWLRGDYSKALDYTQRALAMRRTLGDRRSVALSLNNLGLVYQDAGQFNEALDAFEQALTLRREIGDLVGVSISLNNLGTVAQDQRDDERALALFREAYDAAKETGDRNRIALILTNLGETYSRLEDPATAIHYLRQAEELADELGDKMGLAEAVRGLGKAYLAQGELARARECTARAVRLFAESHSRVQLGVALRSLGEVTAAASAGGQEIVLARKHMLESIEILDAVGNEVELGRSCRAYAEVLRSVAELRSDPTAVVEAQRYAARANEIFARLRMTGSGLHALAFPSPER